MNYANEHYVSRPNKTKIEDFVLAYHETLDSIGANGFDSSQTIIPITTNGVLSDGGHRAAACIYHNQLPVVAVYEEPNEFCFDYDFFKSRELDENVLDYMALEYATLHPNCYVAVVFPSAERHIDTIKSMFREHGNVICQKQIAVQSKFFPINTIRQLYSNEAWVADDKKIGLGGKGKAHECFSGGATMHVVLFCSDELATVTSLKNDIRKIVGVGNHSIHINDHHAETVILARLFFNSNSLHNLTYAIPFESRSFLERLALYKKALAADSENFLVHGSSVMDAYGIRESDDLDYVSLHGADLGLEADKISISNEKPEVTGHTAAALIEDPRHYFYYHGLKFASLPLIKRFKQIRGEEKDMKDIRLMLRKESSPLSFAFMAKCRKKLLPKWKKRMLIKRARKKIKSFFKGS